MLCSACSLSAMLSSQTPTDLYHHHHHRHPTLTCSRRAKGTSRDMLLHCVLMTDAVHR